MTTLTEPSNHPTISLIRGFLPEVDPLLRLPDSFCLWEEVAADMRKLLVAGCLQPVLERLPVLDAAALSTPAEWERAMVLLSFLGHGYVWGKGTPQRQIPAGIAVPWYQVAQRLGRFPVLSYASSVLHNWRRLDLNSPPALGNIAILQNFYGGLDEDWFLTTHVAIEVRAAPLLAAIVSAQQAAADQLLDELTTQLTTIATTLEVVQATFMGLTRYADPYIYYSRVRPFIHGWKDNPILPDGLIYQGVHAYEGKPQRFRGETAAQSAIMPLVDAALGIVHQSDPLYIYLQEMRDYMPPHHRAFVAMVEQGSSIRRVVLEHLDQSDLVAAYNACIDAMKEFRSKHIGFTVQYIVKQAQQSGTTSSGIGTGGTPFLPYLKKHLQDTADQRVAT